MSTGNWVVLLAACTSLTLIGCVDARDAYDDFGDRLPDANDDGVDGHEVDRLPDVDGEWLLSVWPANLPEDRIIKFRATLDLTTITANTGTIDIIAQPLSVADLTAVGEAFLANDAVVKNDATFEAPFVGTLPGEANPVSGSDATVNSVMLAQIRHEDFLCGELTGMAGPLPLEGTQWAAVRIRSETLPESVFRCADDPR